MSLTPLGPGAEFDIIRRILQGAAQPSAAVAVAAGDDCALIRCGAGYLAISLDLSVEDTHFRSDWGSAEEIGGRAVRAAMSDLAAMAATALGVKVALNVPAAAAPELAEQVGLGCRAAVEAAGGSLIGGDLSRGGGGLVIDVAALGEVSEPLLRGGVRPGDELWVSGRLGAAAAAVQAWKAGAKPRDEWRERFWRPTPRLAEARWLQERGAAAGIDLSDGLAADAGHLAAASGVAIELDWETVPAASGVEVELALTGGEDFELLVGAPHDIFNPAISKEFQRAFGIPLTRVGRAASGAGVRVFRAGQEVRFAASGFDHFGSG